MKKYIITGVTGFIGRHFLASLPEDHILGIYHQTAPSGDGSPLRRYIRHDLTQPLTTKGLINNSSKVVIHCAAYAHINKCEIERKLGKQSLAWYGNVEATKNIIAYCKEFKKKLVFLSTECVFSGEKESYFEIDKKHPKNWYGKTKSIAEDLIINSGLSNYLIIRGSVAYGQGGMGSNIIQGMLNNLIYKGSTSAVFDQKISFTYVNDIIDGTLALIDHDASGIYHISGSQITTPYELGVKLCKKLKIDTSQIVPVSMESFFGKEGAKLRCKNAVLNCDKFRSFTKIEPMSVDQGIQKIFVR